MGISPSEGQHRVVSDGTRSEGTIGSVRADLEHAGRDQRGAVAVRPCEHHRPASALHQSTGSRDGARKRRSGRVGDGQGTCAESHVATERTATAERVNGVVESVQIEGRSGTIGEGHCSARRQRSGHSRTEHTATDEGRARVGVVCREEGRARAVHREITRAGDHAGKGELARVGQRDVGGQGEPGGDRVAAGEVVEQTGRLQSDRSCAGDHIGSRGIREGERGEGRVRVQRHRAAPVGTESRRVVHAERAVDTRSAPDAVPVREIGPVASSVGHPEGLTGVAEGGVGDRLPAHRVGCVVPVESRVEEGEAHQPAIHTRVGGVDREEDIGRGSRHKIGEGHPADDHRRGSVRGEGDHEGVTLRVRVGDIGDREGVGDIGDVRRDVVGGVDRVGEEGTAGELGDGKVYGVGHVGHDGDTVETVAEVHPVDGIDEGVGGDGARVGKEAVVSGGSQCPLTIGTCVVDDVEEAPHREVSVDHDAVTQTGGRAKRVGRRGAELKTAQRVGGKHQITVHRDRTDRVAGCQFASHRDRLSCSDRHGAVAGEGLVRTEGEAVREGHNIEGSVHIGCAEIDVRGGPDRTGRGHRDTAAAADQGRAGVAVGPPQRQGAGSYRGKAAAWHHTDLGRGHRLIGRASLRDRDRRRAHVTPTGRGDQDVSDYSTHRIDLGAGGGTGTTTAGDRHKRGADVASTAACDRDIGEAVAPIDIGGLKRGRDSDRVSGIVDHGPAGVDRRAGRSRNEVGGVGRRCQGAASEVQILGAPSSRRADVRRLHRATVQVQDAEVASHTRVIKVNTV